MKGYLTEDEHATWRSWVTATRQLNDQLGRELQDAHGITIADFEILDYLADADDHRMRMNELAELTVSSRSRLSHQIDRLVRGGFVSRKHCPTDGRGLYAVLTRKGVKAFEAAAPEHSQGVRAHFFDVLSQREADTVTRACGKLSAAAELAGAGQPSA